MSEWISVNDRLPEMKEIYPGGPRKARVIISAGWVGEGSYEETFAKRIPKWKNSVGRDCRVTHWQPLPAPPEPSDGKGAAK